MWNDLSLSREEIARKLKISALSVTNHAHRLNLPMNIKGARISNDKAHRKLTRKTFSELKTIYREKWKETLKDNPKANRNKLIKIAAFEYQWLMRNDSKWIKTHLPEVLKIPRKKAMLDWGKIDSELSSKVENACNEIYSMIPPNRVCITKIIRKVGYKKWIEKRFLRLPETTRILKEKLESLENYMIRKLKFAEQKFLSESKIPTRNQLIRRAVIDNNSTRKSSRIQSEITESLILIKDSVIR